MTVSRILAAFTIASLLSGTSVLAQWPAYQDSKVPRTADGKPNLDAPMPRAADGKPDLSGIWLNEWFYGGQVRKPPVSPPGEPPASTFADIGANFSGGLPFQPWAKELMEKRKEQNSKDNPDAHCLPMGLMQFHEHPQPRRMIQTPGVLIILYEGNSGVRQIFTDGRPLPNNDPQPWWYGYSTGKWEGDTLVVTTTGFNDKGWLDSAGHPQTESLRITERYHRRDFGHLEWDITIDDPKVFTKAFTIKTQRTLQADTELLEDVCENERSRARFVVDTSVKITPAVAKSYAGTYELAPGREVVITAEEDLLFVRGLNEPKLPLIPTSQTQFMSTATPAGFEFIKDAQGKVTHLVVRGNIAETKAVRKSP